MAEIQAGEATGRGAGDEVATKPCRACWLPMPREANKCVKCGSIQDWQRYLSFSGTILGLLVALISVLTFAIPIWTRVIVPKVPRPHAVLVEVDNTGLSTFAMSNGGTAPAAVEQILVGRGEGVAMFDLTGLGPGERVIQPSDVKLLKLRLHIANTEDGVWELVKMFRSDAECQTFVGVVTPAGSRESAKVATTTAGLDPPDEPGCELKVRRLIVATLVHLSNDPAFLDTICKVAAAHPDPARPHMSPRCQARAAGRGVG